MTRKIGVPEDYYILSWCLKCHGTMTKKDLDKRKKEGFLRVCEVCYTPLKASLKRCLPLMQKFSQR